MPSYASVVAGTVSVGVASPVLSVIDAGHVSVTATSTLAADLASAIDPSVCAVRNRSVPMTINPTAKVGASQMRKPKCGPVSQVVNRTVLHHGMLWVRFPPTTGLGIKALPSRTIKFRNLVGAAVVRKV
jgi:hypothetical protein